MIGPDRLAPPASVRAIREASPQARHHFTRQSLAWVVAWRASRRVRC